METTQLIFGLELFSLYQMNLILPYSNIMSIEQEKDIDYGNGNAPCFIFPSFLKTFVGS